MRFVIDTNIFISALLKDGAIRHIFVDSVHEFLFPEIIFEEIENHKEELLQKSGIDILSFEDLLAKLIIYVKIISTEEIILFKEKAQEIINSIDPDDAPFFATALAFDCPVWSDDRKLKEQKEVKVYNTKEILELI